MATAFLFVMLPLRARRAGLLSQFMGILGVIAGALMVLRLMPLVPEITQAFWLGAIGALYLGNWPGGRGPAWESGEPEPWPSAAQRRGLCRPRTTPSPGPPSRPSRRAGAHPPTSELTQASPKEALAAAVALSLCCARPRRRRPRLR